VILRILFLWCLYAAGGVAQSDGQRQNPSFEYEVARAHEIQPHRRSIPHEGVRQGFHQLRLTLTVSPFGDVLKRRGTSSLGEKPALPETHQAEVFWTVGFSAPLQPHGNRLAGYFDS